jgi:hypothetical protein
MGLGEREARVIMLSLIACYSLLAFPPVYVAISAFPTAEERFHQSFPRRRLTLRFVAIIVGVAALDFAAVPLINITKYGFRLYVSDMALLLAVTLCVTLFRHSLLGLWTVAMTIGMIGVLSLPAITGH